ncbi:MAG: hypothetical protein V1875_04410 [Candidatus Altiarchaeota archaeon]
MTLAQLQRRQGDDAEFPRLRGSERVRIVGVVHPFYLSHNFRLNEGWNTKPFEVAYMMDELESADRMLGIIGGEAANPSAILVAVGNRVSEEEYKKLGDHIGHQLYESHPRDIFRDNLAWQRKTEQLAKMGFSSPYDELWFFANALKHFPPARIIFFKQHINADSLYKILGERPGNGHVGGVFMGTNSTQCVRNNRNTLCEVLNKPYCDIPIRESAGVDVGIPTSSKRHMKKNILESDAKGSWPGWMREQVKVLRGRYPEGFTSALSLFNPAAIKTMLLDECRGGDYMQRVFGRYRLDALPKALKGLRHKSGDGGNSHFPIEREDVKVIADFLSNPCDFERIRYPIEARPWRATDEEILKFRRKLANYLAGGGDGAGLADEEVGAFGEMYRQMPDKSVD